LNRFKNDSSEGITALKRKKNDKMTKNALKRKKNDKMTKNALKRKKDHTF